MKVLRCVLLVLLIPCSVFAQDTTSVTPDTTQALTFDLIHWEQRPFEIEHFTLDGEALRSVTKTYDADVGTLAVPERRDDPGSRMIELPIIRIRATGPQPAEPIFWFEGGPGQTNMETFDFDYFIPATSRLLPTPCCFTAHRRLGSSTRTSPPPTATPAASG
jgi:hypothetical protein